MVLVNAIQLHWFPLPQPLDDGPFLSSIDSPASRSFLLCATSQLYTRANATSSVVICSRRNSISSSQVSRLLFAVSSLVFSSCSASGIGYDSMTFAPNHKYTSSVGGTSAFAYSVSLSSKVVSMGSASAFGRDQPFARPKTRAIRRTFLAFRNRTVSKVFCMSGILSLRPTSRRWVFCSMNWYFLSASHKQGFPVRVLVEAHAIISLKLFTVLSTSERSVT